jgi:hypothetical protein
MSSDSWKTWERMGHPQEFYHGSEEKKMQQQTLLVILGA